MRRSLNELPALVHSLPPDRLLRHPGEGEWTIAAVIAHLADVELMYGARVRLILTEDRPRLAAYDQERWAMRFWVPAHDVDALQLWIALRRINLRLLDSLSDEEWNRIGVHEESGERTVRSFVVGLDDHDHSHMDQIRRIAGS